MHRQAENLASEEIAERGDKRHKVELQQGSLGWLIVCMLSV